MCGLSIIVPVYNVERYLRKCVDSLLAQDYSDYEIILVDDGSTDGSSQICEEYVRNVESGMCNVEIKVIHQKNGGLSAARNTGIRAAKGEFVCFVDSDDYWEPNVLGGLMEQVERDNLDVLRFRLQYVREVGSQESRVRSQEPFYVVYKPYKSDPFRRNDYSEEPTDGVTFLNERMNTQCYAWMFIIKRSLIVDSQESKVKRDNHTPSTVPFTPYTDTLFTEGIYFEDTDWTPRMLCKAKRVASTDKIVYNYLLTRQGSITNAVNRNKQKKVLDDKMRLVGELKRQAMALQEQGRDNRWFGRMIADTVISIIGILSTDFYDERKGHLERLREMKVFPIQSRLFKARLMNFSPRLTIELLHLKNAKH